MQPNFEQDARSMEDESPDSPTDTPVASPSPDRKISPSWPSLQWRRVSQWCQGALFSPGVLPSPWLHPVFGYLFAVLGQVIAISVLLMVHHTLPFLRFSSALVLLVVLLAALGWGVGPSLTATLIGAALLLLLIFPPASPAVAIQAGDIVRVLPYIVVGLTISLLISQVQRERQAARALAQRLETIIETLPDALVLYDLQGQVIKQNKSARETGLLEQQSLSSAHSSNLRNTNNEPLTFEQLPLSRALRGEQVVDAKVYVSPSDDQPERIFAISAAPLRSPGNDSIEGAITITHELTALRQAEREANERTREFEITLEALPEALYIYDKEGQAIRMNAAGRALLERTGFDSNSWALEQLNQGTLVVVSQGKALSSSQLPTRRILRGEVFTPTNAAEVAFPAENGDELRISVTGAPLRDSTGQITGAVTIYRDATNYRRIEEALRASEERYRTIVETAHEGIWLVDTAGCTLYVNSRMAQLLIRAQEEIEGQTIQDFVFPEDIAATRARIRSNLRGHTEQFEFRFRRSDGSLLETLASTSPIRDATGTIVGALGLFTDLTARKQIEEALQQSEELLHMALRNSPIAVFQQDLDLRYTWMDNPPSLTPEYVVGKVDEDFVSPEEAAHIIKMKRQVLASGESIREEVHVGSGEGERWEFLTIEPQRDRQGTIVGITGTSINITERKRLEKEHERLAQQAYIRASELEAIFEAITDAITVLDAEGRIIQMNQSAKSLLPRYLPTSAIEGPLSAANSWLRAENRNNPSLTEEILPTLRLLQGETLVGAQSQDVEVTTYEGDQLLLNIAGAPLRDAHGNQVGAVAVTRDLTEQRRLEQRTHRALDALLTMAQVMVQDGERGEESFDSTASSSRPITQRLAELTRDVLGCERLSLIGIEADTQQSYPLATVGLEPAQEQFWWAAQTRTRKSLSEMYEPALVARLHQQEIIFIDLKQPPWNRQPNHYGVGVVLLSPLILRTQLIGLLYLDHGGKDHDYTKQDLALIQAASRLIAVILERERLFAEQAQAQQLEAELRATNQRLADLLALAHDAIIVRDPESHILFWNRGAESLYGWTEQEAQGQITHRLLSTHAIALQEMINTQLAETGRWEGRLTHTRRDGEQVLVESRQVLVRTTAGEPEAVLEINRDITEREQLAQERMKAQANELAAREATRIMEEFLGIVGHELRTPLTTIKASVQLARRNMERVKRQETALPEEVLPLLTTIRGLLERTERQVGVQNRLVSDLLDISRIQTGRLELHSKILDIGTLVRQSVEDQQSLTPERSIYIDISRTSSLLIQADEDRLRQVIVNYLSNALKYSDKEKPVIVRVEREADTSRVCVAVSDEGPGLSEEQQQKIWERFYRVPGIEVRSGSGVGLGLGLSISRMLIERQGGQVGVKSQPSKGSTFWFTLPLAEPEAE